MEELRVAVLGRFEVTDVESAELGSRKARHLLQILVLARGRPVSVDAITEALWGDRPPARPADQVAVLASRLRRAIGRERLPHDDRGYRVDVDALDLDDALAMTDRAAAALTAGDAAGALQAARLATAALQLPILPEHADAPWLEADRATAARRLGRSRRLATAAALTADDLAAAVDEGEAALVEDPFDEEVLRDLMTAYVRSGRVASALSVYATVRERMAEVLGVGPSPATEALHTAILLEDPSTTSTTGPATTWNTAADAPPMIGRRDEADLLVQAAVDAPGTSGRVIEVRAEGGMGKSTLLVGAAVAARAAGVTVLTAACLDSDRSVPLQAVIDGVAGHLGTLDPVGAAALLGPERPLLGGLFGVGAADALPAETLSGVGVGTMALFAAISAVLGRMAPVAVFLDDAHLAGPMTLDWIRFASTHAPSMLIVAARRPGEGGELPGLTTRIDLRPFDLDEATQLVGPARADALFERTGGNPLFLLHLADKNVGGGDLTDDLVDAVAARCDRLGPASTTLRTAAVVGPTVDPYLLAEVTGALPVTVLEHLESGVAHRFLDEGADGFSFHHDLLRDALAAGVGPGRAALVHRETARVLSTRPDADPLVVATHARLGGDRTLAAAYLDRAAVRASGRYDHAAADELLTQALALDGSGSRHLARGRVRALGERYADALEDVDVALVAGVGAPALEVGGWAAYHARDFARARRLADDGVRIATDAPTRASCLVLAGRVRHADGDLRGAEDLLEEAERVAEGVDRAVATAWLGVLRSHQSRFDEALDLLRTITVTGDTVDRTNVVLHSLMFTGHAFALGGHPAAALELFDAFGREVDRRGAVRFSGRPENFRAWVLRQMGRDGEADDWNRRAMGAEGATIETVMAAHLDLAEGWMERADQDRATAEMDLAEEGFGRGRDLVFGWRQRLKLRLFRARVALATGDAGGAWAAATDLAAESARLGVPRYTVPARLLAAEAGVRLGRPVDLTAVEADLDELDRVATLDAWRITASVASTFGLDRWRARAAHRAAALAGHTGERRPDFERRVAAVLHG